MISQHLLTMAQEAAKSSLLPGSHLKVDGDTPLGYIIRNITPPEEVLLQTESANVLSTVSDTAYTKVANIGPLALPLAMDEIEQQCINPLMQQVAFVRTVVNPLVREIADHVKSTINVEASTDDLAKIIKLYTPDFIHGAYGEYIRQCETTSNIQKGPAFRPQLDPNLDRNAILDIVKTDSDEINAGLMELSAIYTDLVGGDLITDAWQLIASPNEAIGGLIINFRNFILATAAFIMVDNIVKHLPIKTGLNSEALNTWGAFARCALARVASASLSTYANAIATKRLVQNADRNTITVYGPVYDEFYHEDKMDIMVGIAHSKDNTHYRMLSEVLENAETLSQRGKIALASLNRSRDNRMSARISDGIQASILAMVDTAKEDTNHGLNPFLIKGHLPAEYRAEIGKYINDYFPGDVIRREPLTEVVSRIMCNLFFKDTMAGVILTRMAQVEAKYPKSELSTIVSITMIDILIEWVGCQIQVAK